MFFLKFIRVILGYVRFKVYGDIPERLINKLAVNHITIWNTLRTDNSLEADILARDYKKIRTLRKKTGIRTRVTARYGLPFFIKRNRKRIGMPIGIIIFVLILQFLSLRVWYIKLDGNRYIGNNEILSAAAENGLKIGTKISDLNSVKLKSKLTKDLKDVAWIAVNIEGSRVTLQIRENIITPEKSENYPCNLIAKKDGVITRLTVKEGETKVQVNQAVQKGDLLVSGTIEYKEGNSAFKHSRGEVYAKTEKKTISEQKFEASEIEYTGKTVRKSALNFFTFKIPLYLGHTNGLYAKTVTVKQYKNNDMALPITLYSADFLLKKRVLKKYSEESAKSLAVATADKKEENIKKNCEILKKQESVVNTGVGIKVVRKYICIENIAKEEKLVVNTTN